MATEKDVAAKKDPETQKDVDTKKAPGTGEPSIEYMVDGLTEEELKGVSGGLATGDVTKVPMKCDGVLCSGLSNCVAYCRDMSCGSVSCEKHACDKYYMPN